jgi:hypothetical protein
MTELAVAPPDLLPLAAVAAAAAARADPGPVLAALSAGGAALGGLSSTDALASVAAVWVPVVRRLAADWASFATLVGTAADDYAAVERRVATAAGP